MAQRLGEILLAHGSIDAVQLQAALSQHRARGRPLGAELVDLRFCTRDQVLAALAAQAGLPPIDLDQEELDRSLANVLPRAVAERYRAVPLRLSPEVRPAGRSAAFPWGGGTAGQQEVLAIAIAAPATQEVLETLRALTGARRLHPFLASDQAISRAISRLYPDREAAQATLLTQPTILLYGWPDEDARTLLAGLAARQVPARVAGAAEALAAGKRSILLAPIPEMEALLRGQRCRALLIAASRHAEDFPRAETLDACGFLVSPLDMDCVVRAIQRCHQLLGLSPRLQGAA